MIHDSYPEDIIPTKIKTGVFHVETTYCVCRDRLSLLWNMLVLTFVYRQSMQAFYLAACKNIVQNFSVAINRNAFG